MGGTRTIKRLAAMSAPLLPADAHPEAVTGPVVNSGPTDLPPGSDAIVGVRRLQSGLGELIRYFAYRDKSSVLSIPAATDPAVPPGSRELPWNPTPRSW
jgi:hypothetical protein